MLSVIEVKALVARHVNKNQPPQKVYSIPIAERSHPNLIGNYHFIYVSPFYNALMP